MIINTKNTDVIVNGKKFTIGSYIRATANTEYESLIGVIREIREGNDKVTENNSVDIHVGFFEPTDNDELIRKVEDAVSKAYGEEKTFDEIITENVIMLSDDIEPLHIVNINIGSLNGEYAIATDGTVYDIESAKCIGFIKNTQKNLNKKMFIATPLE